MADEDIKQQADMQREKSAPQPREKESSETSVLEEINAKLGIQVNIARNDVSIQAQILRTNTAGFMALSESFSKLSAGMVEKSSLKDLENQKEAAIRAEETNDLLRGIFGSLKDSKVGKISSGFFSILVGSVGAIIGTIIGISSGFVAGFFEKLFFTFDKDGKRVLRRPFQFIVNLFDDFVKAAKNFTKTRATGLLVGLSLQFQLFIESITKPLSKLRGTAATKMTEVGNRITRIFDSVIEFFARGIKLITDNKFLTKIGGIGTSLLGGIKAIGLGTFDNLMTIPRAVFELISDLAEPIRSIAKAFVPVDPTMTKQQASLFKQAGIQIKKVPGLVKGVGKTLATVLNPFFTFFKTTKDAFFKFGKVLGRIFLPLTIVFGIIDTIRGVIGGLNDTAEGQSKLLSGLFGGLKGLIIGFIGIPLDLLKKGIAFIADKLLGEGNFISDILNAFSFENIFARVIDGVESVFQFIFNGFGLLIEGIISLPETLSNLMANAKDKAAEFIRSLLRSILPDPDGPILQKIASQAIPSKVYEYAGLDPNTGDLIPTPIDPNQQIIDDRELQLASKNMGGGNTQNQIITDASNKAVQNISIVNDTTPKETGAALTSNFG